MSSAPMSVRFAALAGAAGATRGLHSDREELHSDGIQLAPREILPQGLSSVGVWPGAENPSSTTSRVTARGGL